MEGEKEREGERERERERESACVRGRESAKEDARQTSIASMRENDREHA
jgi:hypothetical protein